MNWDQVKGNWRQVRGKVKAQWGNLTDDELDVIDGRRDILVGKVQEAYGLSKEHAERQVREFEGRYHAALKDLDWDDVDATKRRAKDRTR